MLSAYAQRRGSRLSGKTREGISQVKGADLPNNQLIQSPHSSLYISTVKLGPQ